MVGDRMGNGAGQGPAREGVTGFGAFPDADRSGEIDLAKYWALALKHRLLIAGCVIAAVVIAVVVTLMTPPTYTAVTTIQIDREAARVLNTDDGMPRELPVGDEFFQTQYGLLRSRSLVERVVDSEGLANSNDFIIGMGGEFEAREGETATQQAARRRAKIIGLIAGNLGVSPERGSRLVRITFSSPSPAISARMANAIAENFIEANLARKFDSSLYVRDFLEEQIAETKARLEDTERQLVQYAGEQEIISLSDSETGSGQSLVSTSLGTLNIALGSARVDRIAAEERWRQAQNAPVSSIPEVLANPAYQALVQQKIELESEYQQKLSVYQADYPEMVELKARIDELTTQIQRTAVSIRDGIRAQYQIALNQERSLQNQVNALKGEVLDLGDRSVQYNILARELDTSRQLYDGLLQRYKEIGVTGGVTSNNVSMVDRANPPGSPSSPNLPLNLMLALTMGLTIGVVAALLIEALDDRLTTPDDVEAKLGVPALGVIPMLDREKTPDEALRDIRSPFSEAYYSLRTALQFSTSHGAPRSLLVTSTRPGEGKSTTAFATALNLSRIGKRVLLVDGDLRNPSMHRVLEIENSQGMSNFLSGLSELTGVVRKTPYSTLDFIPCGPLPPNPAELWGGSRLQDLLDQAFAVYDHVVIDGPPVLGFADAPVLASSVEGTLFVLESRITGRRQARGALRRLMMGHGRVLGAVLTKFQAGRTRHQGYDYTYDYNYGAEAGDKAGRKV
ncbi:polysaccharide biosynthesis tyrosine autokinase [Brevundimonas sp. A19_0]|uniref:GumC family protein n=1 Tax=Brevundimonas sp. A19_0 TaxID=2821087 RepID=UPI001ADD3B89|nr:polysaccharide biosynthesis tyrosine autokinase [Brevundimonas sp. A19_0]MBO9500307.1 polysaccharide biosynthesis tyrosine autokinase [Brevundimonas sp. A19_0]